jgi:hypothetical protein
VLGTKILSMSSGDSFIKISEDSSITSLEYYYKRSPSQKVTVSSDNGFYQIPYLEGDTIVLESNIGTQYIKM